MLRARWFFVLLALALPLATGAASGNSLFGRRAGALQTEPMPAPNTTPAKEPEDPFAAGKPAKETNASPDPAKEPDDPFAAKGKSDPAGKPAAEDKGVRVQPVSVASPKSDLVPGVAQDFRLSKIDRPPSPETSAIFREAWAAFRSQYRREGEGFTALPGVSLALNARLLQDLGEGRWLAEAQWNNPGHHAWCPRGPNSAQVVIVLEGEGAKGQSRQLEVAMVGLVDVRFDCELPPAEGRRITLRRRAFLETPALPDDPSTREAFRLAVGAGADLQVRLPRARDCKACNGVGYLRRPVPGKIQDARDPCPAHCDAGRVTGADTLTFRP